MQLDEKMLFSLQGRTVNKIYLSAKASLRALEIPVCMVHFVLRGRMSASTRMSLLLCSLKMSKTVSADLLPTRTLVATFAGLATNSVVLLAFLKNQ